MRLLLSLLALLLPLLLVSCTSSRPTSSGYMHSLARAGIILGFDIESDDNHALMLESARWVGSPYRLGGTTRRGVDCSGLVCSLYQEIYDVKLPRTSQEQYENTDNLTLHIRKSSIRSGDLLFFSTNSSRQCVSHVGILLKGTHFIHASSSRGVIVSSLNESYWKKNWIGAARPRK